MKEGDEDEVRLKMKMEVRKGEACLITSVDGESEIKLARTARIGSGRPWQWQWQWQLIELGSYVRSTWSRRGVAHWQARWEGKSDCGWWGLESTADGQRHIQAWNVAERQAQELST